MAIGATDVDKFLSGAISTADRARISAVLAGRKISLLRGTPDDWRDVFLAANWPQNTALICDNQTWSAMGEALAASLSNAGFRVTLLNLGSTAKADTHHVNYIRTASTDADALIAVGSGTLSDLVKFASFQLGKPYAICATAASMNGYLSANAAIMAGGHKQSLPAHLPQLALFDYGVMQAAPMRLNAAGLGDSICRSTAQIDWLLSHHLLGTAYDPLPFALLKPLEDKLLAGDFESLVQTLLLSGLGMTLAGGSYPASQGEHLLAHYVEMQHPNLSHAHYHGEHIAVTTLLMTEIQARILNDGSAPAIPPLKPKPKSSRILGRRANRYGRNTKRNRKH